MKTFIISLTIILLMVAFTAVNSVFFVKIADELILLAESAVDSAGANELLKCWERNKLFLSLSTSGREMDRIESSIISLLTEAGNLPSFEVESQKSLLIYYIEEIRRDEIVSFDSIF